ncbi:site-specific DNA-methyltransferase [uncultured Algoriphagus sp.]|uniref:site-specific DNA-methyltransferase n=1 Tax=uncultured Algoriphagus sp. TaxID=417365 RepID=UPI00258DAFEB|nr:site-specific DNA-methyltransferase [uncultured Algoriphagus sp.]
MPTLNWIGKDKVVSHHQDVPYRVLEHKYGFTADKGEQTEPTKSGNKIIHGDNLEALKSLLPEYEGKIKCIYIDPPYNTGNEGWTYNDNVNHPKIKKWLDETLKAKEQDKVATIGVDDLTRHDKWLCMIYPRLKLLHKLLDKSGAIFISIDDNEQANLQLVCDEIFGKSNFLGTFCWKRRSSSALADKYLSTDHEYILSYQKGNFKSFKGHEKSYKNYRNPNNDPKGDWMLDNLTVGMDKNMRPNQFYDLIDPKTGKVYKPNPNRVWAYIQESMQEKIEQGRIFFPEDPNKKPMLKRYKSDLKNTHDPISTIIPSKSWVRKNEFSIGLNSEATKEIQEIFGNKMFDYSKPRDLVQFFINQTCDKESIILDSFAGSGTTAHAVLNINKIDGGNRKFILVEMEDYANDITAERVKRVTKGYGTGNKKVEGTGGAFDFYELGLPLFDENQNLNEKVGLSKIREYIWFSETRTSFIEPNKEPYFLGKKDESAYYFIYEKDRLTTLDYDALELIKTKGEQYIIYADNCLLPKEFMAKKNIIFKKIPRDITRF